MYLTFNVGPSAISEEVKKDVCEAADNNLLSLSHRHKDFLAIFRSARENLYEFLDIPRNYSIYFVSSATECMEILGRNLVDKKSQHFIFGSFSKRFASTLKKIGKETVVREVEPGNGFNYAIEEITDKEVELAALTYTETPAGVSLAEGELKTFRNKYPDILIAVDIVSAAGAHKINFSLADAWFFSVQKGFGLPAGLGVLIINEKAKAKALKMDAEGKDVGAVHSIANLEKYGVKDQTFETPNVLGLYLLSKQAGRFKDKGMNEIEKETRQKAEYLYSWAREKGMEVLAREEKYKALTVLCIKLPAGVSAEDFHRKLNAQGIISGKGYKEMKETHFRLANFPTHTLEDFKRLTKAIDDMKE
ncbi:MAG: aminotransferase class V-fold PLP-dependent enzyme [Patescibacteria group bacterium]|jgi:phosphoserine aminotransferase